MGYTGGKESTVFQFAKISWTYSMAPSWESHMLLGTSLSATNKKCVACVLLSSLFMFGCVRYSCKYSDVSVIRSAFVLLFIAWMQR